MADYWAQFLTIAFVHFLAVASPGPDFAVVVRQSVLYGRQPALFTSLGIACGILVHVFYSLLGIGLLVSQSITLFNLLKIVGGLYLVYLGVNGLRSNPRGMVEVGGIDRKIPDKYQAFRTGFFTNALNPKATLFFLSLFTVIIEPQTPLTVQAFYGFYMAVATGCWFAAITFFFTQERVREKFLRVGHWFDRLTGAVLIGLGLKVLLSSRN